MNNIGSIKFENCFNKYQDFIKDSDNTKQNNDLILKNYMDIQVMQTVFVMLVI